MQCPVQRTVQIVAVAALIVAGSACASGTSQAPPLGVPERRAVFSGPDIQTVYAERPTATSRSIVGSPAAVRSVVRQVYADYEVPLTVDDSATGQLGNREFYKSVKFAGKRMTELVNCGSGMTGPNAATYRIYMSLLTRVVAESATRTMVSTTLIASARDMSSGATADRINCGSTGALEGLMLSRISALSGQ